jgi:CBS domain-containing protein
MKVERILQAKGSEVFAVLDVSSVGEAVNLLGEKNIGAVVVKDDAGGVVGILSERDVVRRLKSEGAAVLKAKVGACMTRNPVTCAPEDTLDHLMAIMTRRRIRHIPVMRNGRMVGLISIGDVVKRKIEETEEEAAALKEYIAS